ncbi:restriction endonuclease subunit S [Enterococcus casseliflavus]|uniref:restriction endonuclease subunit S n=1 Tax=Enterococcus casseliflavus TaxID=37734 RepID=UPI0035C9CFED
MSEVFLGEVAKERKETSKENKGRYPIVGLEHLIPEEITLTAWDENKENSFTKIFRKGDVLFGRRRAYLKKAVVAPFDGICSGDITVIQALPDKILPELLPFIIQNDALFDFAIGKSAGSLSPRVKWANLKNFRFELPDLKEQSKLASLLWSIDSTKKTYQKLIQKTDELVKSQFMEQFVNGNPYERKRLGNFINQIRGVSYKPADLHNNLNSLSITLLRANNILSGKVNHEEVQFVSKDKVSKEQLICNEDILMCGSSGSLEHVGKAALCSRNEEGETFGTFCKLLRSTGMLIPKYIATYFETDEYRNTIMRLATGSNIKNLKNEHIDNILIPIPPLEHQKQFEDFANQSDKSKFELEQTLSELNATYKRIIEENLG